MTFWPPDGTLLVNRLQIDPAPVQTGAMEYPGDLADWLKTNAKNSEIIDTESIMKELGSRKALNIIMLGALSKHLEFSEEQWKSAIKSQVKEKFLDMNLKAFDMGRSI